mgnify:CR=1 FL=1
MAKLPKAFKRKEHETMRDFSSIPKGDYILKVTKSDYTPNSKKDGHILKLVLEVQNKEHKGAKVFVNLNLDNKSEAAMEMANNELATICDAIGKASIKDTDELMGKLMICKVGLDKDEKNTINMYSSMDSASGEESDLEPEEDTDTDADNEDEVSAEEVTALAKKYKELTSGKKLKEVLEEYDISKVKEIADMEEDDLEGLKEDLEEAIEDEED